MDRKTLLLLVGLVCLGSCAPKKRTEEPATPPSQPTPAQTTPVTPSNTTPTPPTRVPTPLLRFWDSNHNQHVHTYEGTDPANWRQTPVLKNEKVVGSAV